MRFFNAASNFTTKESKEIIEKEISKIYKM